MPKLLCPCGFVHNLSPIPDEGWITVRDKEYEQLLEIEAEIRELSLGKKGVTDKRPVLFKAQNTLQGRMYECPECGKNRARKCIGSLSRKKRPNKRFLRNWQIFSQFLRWGNARRGQGKFLRN